MLATSMAAGCVVLCWCLRKGGANTEQVEWEEFAHWWEANDGQLTFNNRDPTEAHNKTMRQMQESMLQLQHDSRCDRTHGSESVATLEGPSDS
jgi:hypothetical protein